MLAPDNLFFDFSFSLCWEKSTKLQPAVEPPAPTGEEDRCKFNELLFNYAYKYGPEGDDGEDKILYFLIDVLGQAEMLHYWGMRRAK